MKLIRGVVDRRGQERSLAVAVSGFMGPGPPLIAGGLIEGPRSRNGLPEEGEKSRVCGTKGASATIGAREMKGANRELDFSESAAASSFYVWKLLDFGLSGRLFVPYPRLKFMDIVAPRTESRVFPVSFRLLIPNAAKRPRRTAHNEHFKRE